MGVVDSDGNGKGGTLELVGLCSGRGSGNICRPINFELQYVPLQVNFASRVDT